MSKNYVIMDIRLFSKPENKLSNSLMSKNLTNNGHKAVYKDIVMDKLGHKALFVSQCIDFTGEQCIEFNPFHYYYKIRS